MKFTLSWMMVLVASSALIIFDARIGVFVLILAGSVVAVWPLLASPAIGRPRRWAFPYFVSLACLYLPFAWVIWDYPWDDYRRNWIKLWPILPGLFSGIFVHPHNSLMLMTSGTVVVLLVIVLTNLGTFGRRSLVVANGIALIGAGLESWVAYQLFLW